MVKNSLIFIVSITTLIAQPPSTRLEKTCLNCHKKQQIPSELIYRRYLMRYSDNQLIKDKILKYLKNPNKTESIMPNQFFLKFPMKNKIDLNDTALYQEVEEYMNFFDIRKKLILPPDIEKD
ncbi:MAG: hypothetical protein GXO60_06965 [Epsilonproteobacteria bacterium]|nr:hypothetical protein [Campylobacterota bacterium]